MRVLQIIDSLDAGGAERMAVNLANGLGTHKQIDKSFLCTTRAEGLLKSSVNNDVGYLFLDKKKALDIKSILKLNKFIKQNKITIIHAHSTSFFIATIVKLLNGNVKLFWHDHYGKSEQLNERSSFVLKICSRFFTHIFSVNMTLLNWAKNKLSCNSATYLSNFASNKLSPKTETELKGEKGKRILCLANLRPQKDHKNLINAFNKLSKIVDSWTLHCVGKNFNDEYSKSIFKLVDNLKLNESVFFYGSKQDTTNIISQSDIGVLASNSEGLPLALLEYGLGKLTVITTNVGDCSVVITDGIEGRVVPPNDNEKLFLAMKDLIEDEALSKNYSKNLNEKVKNQFSEKAILEDLIKYYTNN
ncbi:glycosyltransferase [Pontimicrobium sp. IMCC45349]|uniref:glycosyltransferase n=1 Tax=Pontimicrobium sp. IMCC45349 TaxID=3391574 RepID=UPI0039A0AC67